MKFSITQNGKKLSKRKYNWDENTKILSTNENNLVLNFSNYNGVTFNTGSDCTFDTGHSCTFTCGEKCVCIRRDIYEVIEIPENKTIKLNKYEIKGYSFQLQKRKIVIDGKEIEMSEESYQNLKKSLINP